MTKTFEINLLKPIDKQFFRISKHILKYGLDKKYKKGYVKELQGITIHFKNLSNISETTQLFKSRDLPIKSLVSELELYLKGEMDISKYPKGWQNGTTLVNSYPEFLRGIDASWRGLSRNEIIYLGNEYSIKNRDGQNPCISIIQFLQPQLLIYQRSCDGMLGGPCDIFQMCLLAKRHKLTSMTFAYGSIHIYKNHIETLRSGMKNFKKRVKNRLLFKLNV